MVFWYFSIFGENNSVSPWVSDKFIGSILSIQFWPEVTLKGAYYVLLVKQLVKSMGTDMISMVNNNLDTFYAIF